MRQQSQVGFGYTVIKEKCPKANDCLVFAEVDPETFTCAKMKLFGQQLKRKYAQYRHARILFFEDPIIADEYLRGIRSAKDIDKDIRGMFEFHPAKSLEYIEFANTKGERFDQVRINIREN